MPDQDRPSELPEVVAAPILVPMFPLPNLFLFPGMFMPLHIFEPRYRQMVEDSLDGPGRIVIASMLERGADDPRSAPPVHPIAGLGEIARHERLEDGRFMIWLAGLTRVRIVAEQCSDRLYRKVLAQPLFEQPASPCEEARLRQELVAAVLARTPDILNIPAQVPLGHLADLLLIKLNLPQSTMQEAYSTLRIAERADCALALHRQRLQPEAGGSAGAAACDSDPSRN